MTFDELKVMLKQFPYDSVRTDKPNYFEGVFISAEFEPINTGLKRIFGLPEWPSDRMVCEEAQKAVREFGGIRGGQTLYFFKEGEGGMFVMIWPWSDNERFTLKAGKI